MKTITTTNGFEIMVDDEDYEFLNRHNWYVKDDRYAITVLNGKQIYMHRLIFGRVPNGCVVDHKDRDKLNNQKNNLRAATNEQNRLNQTGHNGMRKYSNYTGVKSVELKGGGLSWKATASVNGKDVHIGTAKTEIDCAKLRDSFVYKIRGEFAYLNFPDNIPEYENWDMPVRLLKYL